MIKDPLTVGLVIDPKESHSGGTMTFDIPTAPNVIRSRFYQTLYRKQDLPMKPSIRGEVVQTSPSDLVTCFTDVSQSLFEC